jgi:GNAT superfamily N-acetyltransferase
MWIPRWPPLSIEIVRTDSVTVERFFAEHQRAFLKELYGFSVIWHEQTHDFTAVESDATVGALTIRIAASLAHVERIAVLPPHRYTGIGRALLASSEDVANYYNCHKMTLLVPAASDAQQFFQACGYHQEALLPQHTFKLDVAVLRKFLL